MSDAVLRALEREIEAGDFSARVRLEEELARYDQPARYWPEEIWTDGLNVNVLKRGWVAVPRALVSKKTKNRPPSRYEIVIEWTTLRGKRGKLYPKRTKAVVPESWWRDQAARLGVDVVEDHCSKSLLIRSAKRPTRSATARRTA